jgi:hypothetical protein
MRLIIDCDEDLLPHAIAVLHGELAPSYKPWRERYDTVGFGWSHRMGANAACFVRRITDGLSLKQSKRSPPAESGALDRSPEGASAPLPPDELTGAGVSSEGEGP